MYPDQVSLLIDGTWRSARSSNVVPIENPSTGATIGILAHAGQADMDDALDAAQRGFGVWSGMSAHQRAGILRDAAFILRERLEQVSQIITLEQGKPLGEASQEVQRAVETMLWYSGEAERTYGQLIPARVPGVTQIAHRLPIGPVAAFSPWNFPIMQFARKIGAALAAGCSVVCKPAEEAPAAPAELARALQEAGLPAGALNLIFGTPADISRHLIASPVIRKISFTGSTAVGKQLAALAGAHMKPMTMELGGHGPAIVFDDADVDAVVPLIASAKWRNAGQVCVSPTRILVQERLYPSFVSQFVAHAGSLRVGDGLDPDTQMGPLAHSRRMQAMERLVGDAVQRGAKVQSGGRRIGNIGYFFEPTVLSDVPVSALAMNEEPFGPIALISPFRETRDALAEANRLPYGLAAYGFTNRPDRVASLSEGLDSGMIAINHLGLGAPEVPLGGVKDSGYGQEGGAEAVQAFLHTRFITRAGV